MYAAVCDLYGGWRSTSLKQLAHDLSAIVGSQDGLSWMWLQPGNLRAPHCIRVKDRSRH